MELIKLSNRLYTLTKYVAPHRYLVDVGTDHCFVPIYLMQQNIIDGAVAIDVNLGPIKEAQKNIERYGLSDHIKTRLGNGLAPINEDDRLDCILIAGMGGKLISDILTQEAEKLSANKRLILQANVASDYVRETLLKLNYHIVAEEMVVENNIYYEIIVADRGQGEMLTEAEILFGPYLIRERQPLFEFKWQERLAYLKQLLPQIPDAVRQAPIQHEIDLIESVLNRR